MIISLVLAVATDGTIGDKGKTPWQLPSDLTRFRRITEGGTVIMGRKTWDSLPEKFRPLPNRHNIVLTRSVGDDIRAKGGFTATSMQHALSLAGRDTYVIGGAEIFKLFLPVAQQAHITKVCGEFGGDTRFNLGELAPDEWCLTSCEDLTSVRLGRHWHHDSHDSEFYTLRRR